MRVRLRVAIGEVEQAGRWVTADGHQLSRRAGETGRRLAVAELEQSFPDGLEAVIAYDSTEYIEASIDEVIGTLIIAILLGLIANVVGFGESLYDWPIFGGVMGTLGFLAGLTVPLILFVVGYGIDYAQRNRNLPYIGKVRFTG